MKRVGIYARFSSEKQADGYSIEAQLDACRRCLDGGQCEVTEYVDEGKSGATIAGRPELLHLLADAEAGRLHEVLVYKYDRLGRSQGEVATMVDNLEEVGVSVRSATEGADALARGVHIAVAEHYRRQLSERTRDGVRKAAQAGHIGGPAPFGYRRTDTGAFEVDSSQASVVQRIFSDYAAGGSLKGLARQLNAEGIPSPKGAEWRSGTILTILTNPIYKGSVVFGMRRFRRSRKTGKRVYTKRPKNEWLTWQQPELAIVEEATWQAVAARRKKRPARSAECVRTYPLSGIVQCSVCGSSFVAQSSTNKKGRYVYMTCGGRAAGGSCDNHFRFRTDLVQPELMRQLAEVLFDGETVEALRSAIMRLAVEQLTTKDDELARLADAMAECRRDIEATMELMREAHKRGDGTQGLWAADLARLNANLQAMEDRRKDLDIGPRLDLRALGAAIEKALEQQREGLLEMKEPEKIRDALRVLVGRIVAHPDGSLTYKTSPAGLLEPDGALRIQVVAGAGFEPATFRL